MSIPPSIVADVGATNARFATVGASPADLQRVETFRCAEFEGIESTLAAYLRRHGLTDVREVCLAVAGPVEGDLLRLTNNAWHFSRSALEAQIGAPVRVINDFTAQALSLDALGPGDLAWIGGPRPSGPGIRTVLGPGTGLGIAIQTTSGEIIPSEGGHVRFAPADEHQVDLLRVLMARHAPVTAERILSGPGLESLFWANCILNQVDPAPCRETLPAEEVAQRAQDGCREALASVQDFFDILAAFAADMALVTWSTGGVFLSGGVLEKLSRLFDAERFRARFEGRGRFEEFFATLPVAWITHPFPGLVGCATLLQATNEATGATTR